MQTPVEQQKSSAFRSWMPPSSSRIQSSQPRSRSYTSGSTKAAVRSSAHPATSGDSSRRASCQPSKRCGLISQARRLSSPRSFGSSPCYKSIRIYANPCSRRRERSPPFPGTLRRSCRLSLPSADCLAFPHGQEWRGRASAISRLPARSLGSLAIGCQRTQPSRLFEPWLFPMRTLPASTSHPASLASASTRRRTTTLSRRASPTSSPRRPPRLRPRPEPDTSSAPVSAHLKDSSLRQVFVPPSAPSLHARSFASLSSSLAILLVSPASPTLTLYRARV